VTVSPQQGNEIEGSLAPIGDEPEGTKNNPHWIRRVIDLAEREKLAGNQHHEDGGEEQ
jgi:hypothetical protein